LKESTEEREKDVVKGGSGEKDKSFGERKKMEVTLLFREGRGKSRGPLIPNYKED